MYSGHAPTYPQSLRLPLIAAPMFLVSGIDLVVAACAAGVMGAFPTVNCRSSEELNQWLCTIRERLTAVEDISARASSYVVPNLVVHPSNPRLQSDLAVLCRHRPEVVITSVGSPKAVVGPLHDAGVKVWSDVSTLGHAERALACGVDGLVLLVAGAGGQSGHLNPFAFVRAVRAMYGGTLILGGGISDGHALRAAVSLGCDLGYMGTRFIATHESMASPAYREMLVRSSADDVMLTRAFTGLDASMLRPSIVQAGLDPDRLAPAPGTNVGRDLDPHSEQSPFRRWRDIWSAGHSVSGVTQVQSVQALVETTALEFAQGRG